MITVNSQKKKEPIPNPAPEWLMAMRKMEPLELLQLTEWLAGYFAKDQKTRAATA